MNIFRMDCKILRDQQKSNCCNIQYVQKLFIKLLVKKFIFLKRFSKMSAFQNNAKICRKNLI